MRVLPSALHLGLPSSGAGVCPLPPSVFASSRSLCLPWHVSLCVCVSLSHSLARVSLSLCVCVCVCVCLSLVFFVCVSFGVGVYFCVCVSSVSVSYSLAACVCLSKHPHFILHCLSPVSLCVSSSLRRGFTCVYSACTLRAFVFPRLSLSLGLPASVYCKQGLSGRAADV